MAIRPAADLRTIHSQLKSSPVHPLEGSPAVRERVLANPEASAALRRFEEALLAGRNPRIEDFSPTIALPLREGPAGGTAANPGTTGAAGTFALLEELLRVEIVHRLKLGQAFTLDQYLQRFPALARDAQCLARLLAAVGRNAPAPTLANLGDRPSVALGTPTTPSLDTRVSAAFKTEPAIKQFGEYELLHEIAQGGMGVVYKARQTRINRLVALKMIRSGELADAEQVRRFYAEAEAAAKLDHPGIVPVFEVGQADGRHFFSMALVLGGNLNDGVSANGPFPPREAATILKSIAEAVHHAHEKGVIHRDIKPHNILLDENRAPRVTDFGLAKLAQGSGELTVSGLIMGSPPYMSPEQAAGKTSQIGRASDVYSLGATLYFLLTGRPPFQTAFATETIRQVLEVEPVPLRRLNPSIPRDLETICLMCLRKEMNKRYSSAAALAGDLANWLENRPIVARPVSLGEKALLWCMRRPAVVGLSIAVMVMAVVSLATFLVYRSRTQLQMRADRAEGLVTQLMRADSGQVPGIVEDIQDFMKWAAPRLRKLVEAGAFESTDKLHASLALLPTDENQADYLSARLLQTTVEEFPMVRDALRPFASRIMPQLRETLHDADAPLEARFRAGMALVDYAPTSPDWMPADWEMLARQLTLANPDYQRSLRKYLRRADAQLIEPLRSICLDATLRETQRDAACIAITDFAADQVDVLADLIAQVTPPQYAIIEPVLAHAQKSGQAVREALLAIVREKLPEGAVPAGDRLASGRRRGRAAIAAVHFGARAEVLDIFRDAHDLEAQSQFVHGLRDRGLQAARVVECLDRLSDEQANPDRVRYGLLLALGEFSLDAVPAERRESLVKQLAGWHKNNPSAAVHSASGWLLQAWDRHDDLPALDPAELANDMTIDREWIVQRAGDDTLTMTVQPPVKHIMIGTFPDEPDRVAGEGPVHVDLAYTWAIAEREVTRGQFERFQKATNRALLPIDAWSPTAEHPMVAMTWFEAVLYCRWLTLEAGMNDSDQCYPDPDSPDIEKATLEDGTIFPKNWTVDIKRFGFRLPLEIEWEIACRAGTVTGYSFGYDKALLRHYGWYLDNEGKKTHLGGTLRPNRKGMFDMHGNLIEWCNDWVADDYPTPENPDPLKGQPGIRRVYRGGAFDLGERRLRSAWRDGGRPAGRNADCGMRLVRTLAVEPPQPAQSAQ
jgi:formylglycine-generating enzyme required for sulfatase activity/tRNA A-37 threonylcarbamoyl transferase component Bud32